MLLTDDERQRFTEYLEIEAESCDGIATQMDKLNNPGIAMIAKQERMFAVACRLVAKRLRSIESMTISKETP